jgi:hypothetical protein
VTRIRARRVRKAVWRIVKDPYLGAGLWLPAASGAVVIFGRAWS